MLALTKSGHRERRWIVLADDGRYVTLGRHTDPDEDEIRRTEAALVSGGLGGWLAIAEGSFHKLGQTPTLLEVRSLGAPVCSFPVAAEAFTRTIKRANSR